MLSETEKAYLAGVIDCDGSIYIGKNKRKNSFVYLNKVGICNTNKKLIDYLMNKIEFSCSLDKRQETNFKVRRKNRYLLSLNHKQKIIEFLEQLVLYLIIKKKQAKLMIEFCENRLRQTKGKCNRFASYSDRDHEIYKEIKRLNHI